MTLLNWHLLSGIGCWMVSHFSTKDGRNWSREIYYRSWKNYTASLKGPPREVRVGYRQRKARPETHAFLRICGWSALGFQAKAWSVNSNQKRGLVSSTGILSKGFKGKEGSGRWRKLSNTGLLGKSYQELIFACAYELLSRACTCMRGLVLD